MKEVRAGLLQLILGEVHYAASVLERIDDILERIENIASKIFIMDYKTAA